MDVVLLGIQLMLAVLFLLAATGKALRSEEFVAALQYSRVPPRLVGPVGVAVPVLELGLAAALTLQTPSSLRVAFAVGSVLIAAFTVWMGWVYRQGLRLQCGCFGTGSAEIGPRSVGRNLILLGLAVGGAVLAVRTHSLLPEPSLSLVVTVTAVGLGVALLDALRTVGPELVLDLGPGGRGSRLGREG